MGLWGRSISKLWQLLKEIMTSSKQVYYLMDFSVIAIGLVAIPLPINLQCFSTLRLGAIFAGHTELVRIILPNSAWTALILPPVDRGPVQHEPFLLGQLLFPPHPIFLPWHVQVKVT
jgi:hypothetical protein